MNIQHPILFVLIKFDLIFSESVCVSICLIVFLIGQCYYGNFFLVFKDLRCDFENSQRVIVACCNLNNVPEKWKNEIATYSSSSSS